MPEWWIERGIGETRAALIDDDTIVEARIEIEGLARAGSVVAGVELSDHLQQRRRAYIEYRFRHRVIAGVHRITGHGQHVANPQHPRGEQIRLQRHAISIPAGQLQDRLQPLAH